MAWLPTEPPWFFVDQLTAIDNTCARAALGTLKTTPAVFLWHDLNMTPPNARLQSKVLSFMARSLAKPTSHPFYKLIQQAQLPTPKRHRNPFHSFLLQPLYNQFAEFITQLPVDPASNLTRPGNLSTIIQANGSVEESNTKQLKPSNQHLLIFSDGLRIPGKSTEAAAWCANDRLSRTEHLGPATSHGIYQAEYCGVQLALTMALDKATAHTMRTTIVLDNLGVVKDLHSNSHSISSLDNRQQTFKMLNYLHHGFPHMQITVRWCPGHQGIPGNEALDKLANALKKPLPDSFTDTPNTAAFIAAIKEWRKTKTKDFNNKDRKRLGQEPCPRRHLESLSRLLKHEIATITQL